MNIAKDAILEIIKDHPGLRKCDIGATLHVHHFKILNLLNELKSEGKIKTVYHNDPANMEFYDRYYLNI